MHLSHDVSISDLLTTFSILIAVAAFLWDRKKTRDAMESEIFDSLNQKWIELLEKFIEYPDIILDFGKNKDTIPKEEKKKTIYCHILLSTLEMAYLKYGKASKKIRLKQWSGWDQYIETLFNHTELNDMWREQLCSEYDEDFVKYIESKVKNAKQKPSSVTHV